MANITLILSSVGVDVNCNSLFACLPNDCSDGHGVGEFIKGATMKAAVCYEFGQPMVVEEIEIDPPQYGEVKVRIAATAICHSDVHIIRGEWGGEAPW